MIGLVQHDTGIDQECGVIDHHGIEERSSCDLDDSETFHDMHINTGIDKGVKGICGEKQPEQDG
jgi:hypothetical protein